MIQGDAFDADALRAFVRGLDVVVCAYLGDNTLMVDGQKALIDACEAEGVPRYVASDWSLDYTKLALGELFPKDPMIHIKAYLEQKPAVKGVHILVGGFMDPQFSPLFGLWHPDAETLRFWGTGDEIWEGTTYENAADFTAAVCLDKDASGVLKCLSFLPPLTVNFLLTERSSGWRPQDDQGNRRELLQGLWHHPQTRELRHPAGAARQDARRARRRSPEHLWVHVPVSTSSTWHRPNETSTDSFSFFTYYWLNGQTYVGPELDNAKYPEVKPVTWEDYMAAHTLEELTKGYSQL